MLSWVGVTPCSNECGSVEVTHSAYGESDGWYDNVWLDPDNCGVGLCNLLHAVVYGAPGLGGG